MSAATPLTIARVGHRGDGIAEGPDGPVYVPRTLPGEVVTGDLDGDRLRAPRILTPSADRVRAPCRHYGQCGGCALQHAAPDWVAGWKRDVVVQALAAHGLVAEMRPIATSPPQSRRRAGFAARRRKSGVTVGFHALASDTVVDIPECHLLHPDLLAARAVVAALAGVLATRRGGLSAHVTTSEGGLDIDLSDGRAPQDADLQALAKIAHDHGIARLSRDGVPLLTLADPLQRFDGIAVTPPPGAFLQATAHGEAVLRDAVLEAVGDAARIADLFAGCGTFALPLARQAEVHAVEGQGAMTEALLQGWRHADGLRRVTASARDLFRRPLLPDELRGLDAVVLDPPRAGAAAQIAEIARAQVPRVAYVSCSPVTFARDVKTLCAAGFRLNWVQVVDQFRWSSHVELAASLSADHIAA